MQDYVIASHYVSPWAFTILFNPVIFGQSTLNPYEESKCHTVFAMPVFFVHAIAVFNIYHALIEFFLPVLSFYSRNGKVKPLVIVEPEAHLDMGLLESNHANVCIASCLFLLILFADFCIQIKHLTNHSIVIIDVCCFVNIYSIHRLHWEV